MKRTTRKKKQARADPVAERRAVNLTAHEVDLLFVLRAEGHSYSWLAEKFEISKSYAFALLTFRRTGDRWRGRKGR